MPKNNIKDYNSGMDIFNYEELSALSHAVGVFYRKASWDAIARYAFPAGERTSLECMTQWKRMQLDNRKSNVKGVWTREEDHLLRTLVTQFGTREWAPIGDLMICRDGKQCRERWYDHLKPGLDFSPITAREDEMLASLIRDADGNHSWAKLARHFANRSENTLKNYWNTKLRRMEKGKRRRGDDTEGRRDISNVRGYEKEEREVKCRNFRKRMRSDKDSCGKIPPSRDIGGLSVLLNALDQKLAQEAVSSSSNFSSSLPIIHSSHHPATYVGPYPSPPGSSRASISSTPEFISKKGQQEFGRQFFLPSFSWTTPDFVERDHHSATALAIPYNPVFHDSANAWSQQIAPIDDSDSAPHVSNPMRIESIMNK